MKSNSSAARATAASSLDQSSDAGSLSPAYKLVAPLVGMGVSWVVRKAMAQAYTKRTGKTPPKDDDGSATLTQVIVWAATTAAVAAAIDAVVQRATVKATEKAVARRV